MLCGSAYSSLLHRLTYLPSNMYSNKQYPGCNHAALVNTHLPTYCTAFTL